MQRYLYPASDNIWLDPNGLLLNHSKKLASSKLIDLQNMQNLSNGILLAEGGMGKTTFLEQFQKTFQDHPDSLFKLGEYAGDLQGFREEFHSCIASLEESDQRIIIIDGLDEAPDLTGIILRELRSVPETIAVWIASRDIGAIRSIQSEFKNLKPYKLAPLSEADIRQLATRSDIDGDDFLHAAKQQGILPLCIKPLGCKLAISLYQENGSLDIAQHNLWQRGIERLCDETPSPTRHMMPPSPFALDDIVHCSAWIALCLTLSENHYIWSGEKSHSPNKSLSISDLSSENFSVDLIRTSLERGVFTPLGDGRILYSHAIYKDYLAASGFVKFISSEQWLPLLMNGQRDFVFPQRAGIAAWLAAYNNGFLEELLPIHPELLVASADSVQAIGPENICAALLKRAETLSYQQRQSKTILSNLHRLNCPGTLDILKKCLLDKNSSSSTIELAITIVEKCQFSDLADILADRIMDESLNLRERVDAGYALRQLNNEEANKRLKSLLPINPIIDLQDELLGIVLQICWPKHCTPDEIINYLTPPQKPMFVGAYHKFIEYDLPASFKDLMNEKHAIQLLNWALPNVKNSDHFDPIGKLARAIYTSCWKWSKDKAITELLAIGYADSLQNHRSPFINKGEYLPENSSIVSKEEILKNTEGRFTVLRTIFTQGEIKPLGLSIIGGSDIPLFTSEDLPLIFEIVFEDPKEKMVPQWVSCIKTILMRNKAYLNDYADHIDKLNNLRPDLIDDCKKIFSDFDKSEKDLKKMKQESERTRKEISEKHKKDQQEAETYIQSILNAPAIKPELFESLFTWLNSKNGRPTLGSIDIRLSHGWNKLTEDEQNKVIDLAQRYLMAGKIVPTAPNRLQFYPAGALTYSTT